MTGCATVTLFFAPAGSLLEVTGFWQSVRCPVFVTVQVMPFFAVAPLPGDTAADGPADAPMLGVADGLGLGVAALAIPLNPSAPAAVRISTAGRRRMPSSSFTSQPRTSLAGHVVTAEASAEAGRLQVRDTGPSQSLNRL